MSSLQFESHLPSGEQALLGEGQLTAKSPELIHHPQANQMIVLVCGNARLRLGYHQTVARRRTIGMQITADGLMVRVPAWVGQSEVERVLQQKALWIVRQLQAMAAEGGKQALSLPWAEGACVAYGGKWLRVVLGLAARQPVLRTFEDPPLISKNARCVGYWMSGETQGNTGTGLESHATHALYLPLRRDAAPLHIAVAVERWLKMQARLQLMERCAVWAPLMGVAPTRLTLTNANSRWGSASSDGAVRLHWRLVQMDPALFDYVLVHELAHLHEMNHGPKFWAHVQRLMPDYNGRRQCLKQIRLHDWQ